MCAVSYLDDKQEDTSLAGVVQFTRLESIADPKYMYFKISCVKALTFCSLLPTFSPPVPLSLLLQERKVSSRRKFNPCISKRIFFNLHEVNVC